MLESCQEDLAKKVSPTKKRLPCFVGDLYAAKGIASFSVKHQLNALLMGIKENGLTSTNRQELRRLLCSLDLPHRKGTSPIAGYHIMGIKVKEGVYKNSADPYIDCEILSSCIADAVFETMENILDSVYALRIENRKFKWEILDQDRKVGDLFYDMDRGVNARRLRFATHSKMIVICWNHEKLLARARIHFDPQGKRYAIMEEVLPFLVKKQKEFEAILVSRPRELFQGLLEASWLKCCPPLRHSSN